MSLLSSFNCDDPEERKGSGLRSAEILLRKILMIRYSAKSIGMPQNTIQ